MTQKLTRKKFIEILQRKTVMNLTKEYIIKFTKPYGNDILRVTIHKRIEQIKRGSAHLSGFDILSILTNVKQEIESNGMSVTSWIDVIEYYGKAIAYIHLTIYK